MTVQGGHLHRWLKQIIIPHLHDWLREITKSQPYSQFFAPIISITRSTYFCIFHINISV